MNHNSKKTKCKVYNRTNHFYFLLLMHLIFLSCCCFNLYGQIDTNDVYPLAKGNRWEYKENFTKYGYIDEVQDDTLMDNGKVYYRITSMSINPFGRKEMNGYYLRCEKNLKVYKYLNSSYCTDKEELLYDFSVPIKSMWYSCELKVMYPARNLLWGCRRISQKYIPFTLTPSEERLFTDAEIKINGQPTDTIWGTILDGSTEYTVMKGLGVTQISNSSPSSYPYNIVGAIINGVKYGKLTDVNSKEFASQIPNYYKISAYPNPFNPSTIIRYEIPKEGRVNISIFNLLGQKIAELVNGQKAAGEYVVMFDGSNLSSGIYFFRIQSGAFIETKKLVLQK